MSYTSRYLSIGLLAGILVGGDVSLPALAQDQGDQAPQSQLTEFQKSIPSLIRPGTRLTYKSSSSYEKGGAVVGLSVLQVVAVTEDRVLFDRLTVNPDPQTNQQAIVGISSAIAKDFEMRSGGAPWIGKDILDSLKSTNGTEVTKLDWPTPGKTYKATSVTIVDKDTKTRRVYEIETGLTISEQVAVGKFRKSGGENDGFNRESQELNQLEAVRFVELPWLEFPQPEWVRPGVRLRYEGSKTVTMAGTSYSEPVVSTVQVKEAGKDWSESTLDFSISGNSSQITVVSGPGKVGGLWIHPGALSKLRDGMIDEDPLTRSVLSYAVQEGPLGKLGVLRRVVDGGASMNVWGYSLEDGRLVYERYTVEPLMMTLEMRLVGN